MLQHVRMEISVSDRFELDMGLVEYLKRWGLRSELGQNQSHVFCKKARLQLISNIPSLE